MARRRVIPGKDKRAQVVPFTSSLFYRAFTQVLNRFLRSSVQMVGGQFVKVSNDTLHSNRVHRTMMRRRNHNIWSSCHVAVFYIKGYVDPESRQ